MNHDSIKTVNMKTIRMNKLTITKTPIGVFARRLRVSSRLQVAFQGIKIVRRYQLLRRTQGDCGRPETSKLLLIFN